jgi:hypothetical protein
LFYFIVAIFNLVIGFGYLLNGHYGSETPWGHFPRLDFPERIARPFTEAILNPLWEWVFGPVFKVLISVICTIFKVVAGGLGNCYGVVRFSFHLSVRLARMASQRTTRVSRPPKKSSDTPSTSELLLKDKTRKEVDVKVLPFELVCKIAEDLHYTDLLYASRASPRLRMMLFGVHDPDSRIEALREKTCDGQLKSSCEICSNQVCDVSSKENPQRQSPPPPQISFPSGVLRPPFLPRTPGFPGNSPP